MATETRSANEIERDIEESRSDLSRTIDEIQHRFTPEAVVNEVMRNFRTHGSDMGRSVGRSIQQNPIGLTLTAVGLAWMIFGRSHDDGRGTTVGGSRVSRPLPPEGMAGYGRDWGDDSDWNDSVLDDGDDWASSSLDTDPARTSHYPEWYGMDDPLLGDPDTHDDDHWGTLGETRASSTGDDGPSMADRGRDRMRSAYSGASERAARMRERLSRGTEDMGEEARARVVAARRRAVEARRRAAASARRGWTRGRDGAMDFFESQPLVAGALALAAGAALAASLPRTRYEDEAFGEQSDALMHEAERIFAEEREKATRVARAGLDEADAVASEKGAGAGDMVDKAKREAEDATRRVKDRMADEARKQDLGNPRT